MHPTLIARPVHHEGWVYEEKVDGYRMLAYKQGSVVRLISRQGKDHTRRFSQIAAALSRLETSHLILDGEVAVYDRQLMSRFEWLRHTAPPEPRHRSSWSSIACMRETRISASSRCTCAAT